jgi:DUF1680 family protein
MMDLSRRQFFKTSAGAAGLCLIAHSTALHALTSGPSEYPAGRLEAFPLASVRLTPGLFQQQAEINARYLDSLTIDRLLHSFRLTAGITSTATPYGGWEAPDCELRGHFNGGHFLSAAALSSASAGNSVLKSRGEALVSGLITCQKKIGTGYVSAFPEDLFERLAQDKPVWAPFYTYHKIMAGLVDMYLHAGNTEALQVAEGMAQWAQNFMSAFSFDQRQRMLRNEFGGTNEVLINLAAITQKQRYLDAALLFEQPSFLDPLAQRRDELQSLHANTNVPKIIGAARMYEVTGDRRYRDIAEYFLAEVLTARSYAIGNTSVNEHWTTPPDQLKGTLAWANAECCVAYNLMKLQRHVFSWTADARWMDAYERTLFNCRLGTQNPQGLKQYFFPLAAGYWRAYNSPEESFWCCTGTGAEDFAKFSDTIYFRRGADLYVNQFIASTLDWKDQNFALEQTTHFPTEQSTTLKIKSSRPAPRTIHLRIPSWTTEAAQISINGQPLEAMSNPGSYLAIHRSWKDGDIITLTLPMHLHQEFLAGDPTVAAPLYGPLVLATDLGAGPDDGPLRIVHGRPTIPKDLPPSAPLPQSAAGNSMEQWIHLESAPDLRFTVAADSAAHPLKPMYQLTSERYATYWQLPRKATKPSFSA